MNWHIPVTVYGTRSCRNAHVKQNVRKNTKWFSLSQLNTMTSIKKKKKVSFSDIHHPWVCTSGEQIYHWEKPHAFETYVMYSQSLCPMDKPDNNLICGFAILFYYFFSSRRTNEIVRIFFFLMKKANRKRNVQRPREINRGRRELQEVKGIHFKARS